MFTTRGRNNHKRKYIVGVCAAIFFYLFLFTRFQTFEYDAVIKNAPPEAVWNYIADFSKMKTLNPTIKDFKILSDDGNNEDWKYSVEYTETLSHWPHTTNINTGNFHVHKIIKNMKLIYMVESTHKTCFFGLYCIKSMGEFQVSDLNEKDSLCVETVKYQCPPFMASLCRKEVEYQRKHIMSNLQLHFSRRQD